MRKGRRFILGDADPQGRARFVHVVTRTAGQQILFGDDERERFRKILFKQLKFSGLRALAWCLMGNHLHLLLELPDKEKALAGWTEDDLIARLSVFKDEMSTRLTLADVEMFRRNGHAEGVAEIAARVRERLFDLSVFMKELKQRMTLAYNFGHGRSGTLWEGRFRAGVVQAGAFTLQCLQAVDSLAVRQEQSESVRTSDWTSAPHRLGLRRDAWLTDPPEFWQLGNTPFDREAAYAALLARGLGEAAWQRIEHACANGWALGSADFVEQLSLQAGRPVRPRARGRPPRRPTAS